jgi:hypothetical protein
MVVSVGADRSRKRQANRSLLTRRNSTSATGQFNSVRHDGVLRAFQSKWFETQPDTIELPGGRWYTADVFATFRRGRRPVYREVKKRAALETDPDLEGRYLDIVAACEERGADFEIVLEGYWLEPVRWSITSLLRHSVRRASRIEKDIVRMALEDGAMSLAEIMRATSLSHAGRSAALALAADGVATFRRDRAVTLDTLVRLV